MKVFLRRVLIAVLALCLTSVYVQAAPITWNTWTSATTGTLATFDSGGSYSASISGGPTYTPTTTFADGSIVDNAPVAANGIMRLTGGNDNINTVIFSESVINPVFAIWSLGGRGTTAGFDFGDLYPIFVVGGPSYEYGGTSIAVTDHVVSGDEVNGTVQFLGTYSSISWTNPVCEDWYGFNVGVSGSAPVPEPATFLLLGSGLVGLAFYRRKRK